MNTSTTCEQRWSRLAPSAGSGFANEASPHRSLLTEGNLFRELQQIASQLARVFATCGTHGCNSPSSRSTETHCAFPAQTIEIITSATAISYHSRRMRRIMFHQWAMFTRANKSCRVAVRERYGVVVHDQAFVEQLHNLLYGWRLSKKAGKRRIRITPDSLLHLHLLLCWAAHLSDLDGWLRFRRVLRSACLLGRVDLSVEWCSTSHQVIPVMCSMIALHVHDLWPEGFVMHHEAFPGNIFVFTADAYVQLLSVRMQSALQRRPLIHIRVSGVLIACR